ncbi:hypothetical protein BDEG_25641 [Batrachochytrium dendrobatidis JEL423]|uniref:Uncharacterized protein n=1 Tax=Batrachochytrium dendrobatidis (strain JEL423) TaxID=403673 RepID=A0A177WQH6_BATDL|nr:hypothetical protein BDEG_25641 [Batrachochytrium dendrobatidis JEL423]
MDKNLQNGVISLEASMLSKNSRLLLQDGYCPATNVQKKQPTQHAKRNSGKLTTDKAEYLMTSGTTLANAPIANIGVTGKLEATNKTSLQPKEYTIEPLDYSFKEISQITG